MKKREREREKRKQVIKSGRAYTSTYLFIYLYIFIKSVLNGLNGVRIEYAVKVSPIDKSVQLQWKINLIKIFGCKRF